MEEVRDFQLAGDLVGIFHRFEPNVSFWTLEASKTILCINIQDQLRGLAEEDCSLQEHGVDNFDDADSGLSDEEEDHVTSSVSVNCSAEHALLVYGTRSGCIFGLSTRSRSKIFSIPFAGDVASDTVYPSVDSNGTDRKRDVKALSFLTGGKIAVVYEGYGLALLDFDVSDPPDRPTTRGRQT